MSATMILRPTGLYYNTRVEQQFSQEFFFSRNGQMSQTSDEKKIVISIQETFENLFSPDASSVKLYKMDVHHIFLATPEQIILCFLPYPTMSGMDNARVSCSLQFSQQKGIYIRNSTRRPGSSSRTQTQSPIAMDSIMNGKGTSLLKIMQLDRASVENIILPFRAVFDERVMQRCNVNDLTISLFQTMWKLQQNPEQKNDMDTILSRIGPDATTLLACAHLLTHCHMPRRQAGGGSARR